VPCTQPPRRRLRSDRRTGSPQFDPSDGLPEWIGDSPSRGRLLSPRQDESAESRHGFLRRLWCAQGRLMIWSQPLTHQPSSEADAASARRSNGRTPVRACARCGLDRGVHAGRLRLSSFWGSSSPSPMRPILRLRPADLHHGTSAPKNRHLHGSERRRLSALRPGSPGVRRFCSPNGRVVLQRRDFLVRNPTNRRDQEGNPSDRDDDRWDREPDWPQRDRC
jgi:ribosomal protein L34